MTKEEFDLGNAKHGKTISDKGVAECAPLSELSDKGLVLTISQIARSLGVAQERDEQKASDELNSDLRLVAAELMNRLNR